MDLLCIVEPSPEKSRLGDLCQALGVSPVIDAVISHVEILPKADVWRVYLDQPVQESDGARLAEALASALQLDRVELLCDPGWQEIAATSETLVADSSEEVTDEEYMESIMQRIQDEQNNVEKGDGSQSEAQVILGKDIKDQEPQPLSSITDEERSVIVRGRVLRVDVRQMRSGRHIVMFDITDNTDSISVKAFAEESDEWMKQISPGSWLCIRGSVQHDNFSQELTLQPRDICRVPAPPMRPDTAPQKRVELHLHTKMSALDGVADITEIIRRASEWNHPAIAITDHGVVQAFPEAYAAGKKHGIKILYGLEGYLANDDDERGSSYHIVILAATREGLRNLYRLVSLSHIDHFYRRPRLPRRELQRLREGLLLGSACEAGELYQALLAGASDEQAEKIASFYDYLEIQPLDNTRFHIEAGRVSSEEALKDINKRIVAIGRKLGKPVVATSDAHYIDPEDEIYRRILMAGHGFTDIETSAPLFLKSTDEMLAEFAYLGEELANEVVVQAPQQIADRIEDLRPIPEGFHPPRLENAEENLQKMCEENARILYGQPLPELVATRLEQELRSIIDNGFASLYMIAHELVAKSLGDGYIVGSRGSVGSSFVALLCGVSEVNPLPPHYACPSCHHFEAKDDGLYGSGPDLPPKDCPQCGTGLRRDGFDIPFETFLGFDGVGKVPDIDLNFSGEYQPIAHQYTETLFGRENVFRAGTIATLAEKTAYGYVRKYLDEKGIVARSAEVNRLSLGITGVRRTSGQHPGGIMVVPRDKEIFDFTPIQYPANDKSSEVVTTHFAYSYMEDQLVKLDILGHDGPTMIRLLEQSTGVKAKDIALNDAKAMSIFSSLDALGIGPEDAGSTVGTLGIPEYNTRFVRQMLEDTRPTTFADLVRIMGLSHGTDVWLNNAQDLVRQNTATLAETIACRDDIMIYLIRKGLPAATAFEIMERVRKGRGLSSEDESLMLEYDVPRWYIDSCKKISYLFPKAHAAAYAIMAFWQAFYKVHYPLPFYAAYFSVRANEFDAQLIMQGKSVVKKTLKQLDEKGNEATGKERSLITLLEVALEAMARGVGFLPVDLYESEVSRFIIADNKLRPPLIGLQGVGESAAEALVKARQERPFTSVEDLRKRAGVSRAVTDVLMQHGALADLPESDQLTLF
ncbi:MAG: PolC-type DNA polymerase III [Limnochordia bacterium]